MTGPEHYREAERLRADAWHPDVTEGGRTALLADAQVHATLAHAAAVIDQDRDADSRVLADWREVTR